MRAPSKAALLALAALLGVLLYAGWKHLYPPTLPTPPTPPTTPPAGPPAVRPDNPTIKNADNYSIVFLIVIGVILAAVLLFFILKIIGRTKAVPLPLQPVQRLSLQPGTAVDASSFYACEGSTPMHRCEIKVNSSLFKKDIIKEGVSPVLVDEFAKNYPMLCQFQAETLGDAVRLLSRRTNGMNVGGESICNIILYFDHFVGNSFNLKFMLQEIKKYDRYRELPDFQRTLLDTVERLNFAPLQVMPVDLRVTGITNYQLTQLLINVTFYSVIYYNVLCSYKFCVESNDLIENPATGLQISSDKEAYYEFVALSNDSFFATLGVVGLYGSSV